MHSRGTRASYRIRQRLKLEDTSIERFVCKVIDEFGIRYHTNVYGRTITVSDGANQWELRPDIIIETRPSPIIIEVLGPYHYKGEIQPRKTEWRNRAIANSNYRVINVCYQLCKNEFRDYLKAELLKALVSDERIVEIPY